MATVFYNALAGDPQPAWLTSTIKSAIDATQLRELNGIATPAQYTGHYIKFYTNTSNVQVHYYFFQTNTTVTLPSEATAHDLKIDPLTGYGEQSTWYRRGSGEPVSYAAPWRTMTASGVGVTIGTQIYIEDANLPFIMDGEPYDPTMHDEHFFAKNVGEYSFNIGVAADQSSDYDTNTHIWSTRTYKITLRWVSPVSGEAISVDLNNLVYNSAAVVVPPLSPFYAYDCLYGITNMARAYRMPIGGYASAADIPTAWADLTDKRAVTTMTLQELKDLASMQQAGITNNDLFTEIFADFKDTDGNVVDTKSISYASLFGEDIDINSSTVQDPNELPTLPDDNRYTDAIDLTVPALTGTGVFNRCYVLDANGVNDLCDYLYNADDSIFDEIIDGVLTRGNPIESLIDLRLYPFDVRTFTGAGTSEAIKFGRTNTGIIGIKLPHNANAVISLGSCTVYRNFSCFLDYLSTVQLYIPFCGVCDLPIDRVLNHKLSIKLIVDYVTGACTAVVYCDGLPLLYRPGVIGVSIPMTATNSAEFGKTIVGNLVKGAEGAISKNPAAVISAAGDTAGKLFDGSSIQSVGSSSPQTALFQPKDAYLLISQVVPASGVYDSVYGELVGYACFTPVSAISERVGTGFNVFDNVKLSISTATEAEREEILDYLTSGVFL